MRILVTGAAGQLGRELAPVLEAAGHEVVPRTRDDGDLAIADNARRLVSEAAPDWVVNCAAYTQVDRAESEPALAQLVNGVAPGALAAAARSTGARLLHISTDFVFSGAASRPYREDDPTGPLSVYGRTKLAGEHAVRDNLPTAIILRTAWVHGALGPNFVRTMLRLAAERDTLRVVADQLGTPTWTGDLARAIAALVCTDATGTLHFTSAGQTSWHGLATEVVRLARELGLPVVTETVEPIGTADYPTPATRPAYSVLDTSRCQAVLPFDIPAWELGVRRTVEGLAERC